MYSIVACLVSGSWVQSSAAVSWQLSALLTYEVLCVPSTAGSLAPTLNSVLLPSHPEAPPGLLNPHNGG